MLTTPSGFVSLNAHQATSHTHCFIFRGGELLVREADLSLPDPTVRVAIGIPPEQTFPVGLLNDDYCCAAWVDKQTAAHEGFAFTNLRRLFGAMDEPLLAVAARASQIAEWARTHRYCGACATATIRVEGERCFKCPACGHVTYPRISPAMMVLIKRGDAILLARHTASPTQRFTALAGFLEAGESIEEAVHREVFEEVGLRIKNLHYFGSQSWPFPHSLMIAFTADYAGGEIVVDRTEIAEARWFGPGDEVPEYPPGVSIAGGLIGANLPNLPRGQAAR